MFITLSFTIIPRFKAGREYVGLFIYNSILNFEWCVTVTNFVLRLLDSTRCNGPSSFREVLECASMLIGAQGSISKRLILVQLSSSQGSGLTSGFSMLLSFKQFLTDMRYDVVHCHDSTDSSFLSSNASRPMVQHYLKCHKIHLYKAKLLCNVGKVCTRRLGGFTSNLCVLSQYP